MHIYTPLSMAVPTKSETHFQLIRMNCFHQQQSLRNHHPELFVCLHKKNNNNEGIFINENNLFLIKILSSCMQTVVYKRMYNIFF
jgi:hypothetical protein